MSRLPQLERALVVAAATRPARRRPFRVRPVLAPMGALVAVACVAFVLALFDRGEPEVSLAVPTPDALALSRALTTEATAPKDPEYIVHSQLPSVAAGYQARTPYPPGARDAFDWLATPAGPYDLSSINDRQAVQFLVEYRAQCLWLRYWLDTRAPEATQVLQDVPDWPALRSDADAQLSKNAAAAAAGDAAPIQYQADLNCRM